MEYVRLGNYADVITESADLIFTSPPYNIGSKAPRSDGKRKDGQFDKKSYGAITGYPDSMDEAEYQQSQIRFLRWAANHLNEGGVLVYNHKPRRNGKMIHPASWFLSGGVPMHLTLMEEIIWDRGSTHNHSPKLMWPQTERLYVFRRAQDKAYSYTGDEDTPFRSDLWHIPNIGKRPVHNAPFPILLAKSVIQAFSRPGQLVMDPYSGSGTTGEAAMILGRSFIGAEVLKKYQEPADTRVNVAALNAATKHATAVS
jgi:DNA modification methylase